MATLGGSILATPNAEKRAIGTNYTSLVDFEGTPFLPDVYEKQVHTYGNRMITGFLKKVSAEYALQSSQVTWTEEGRLELRYTGVTRSANVFTISGGHVLRIGQKVKVGGATGAVATGRITAKNAGDTNFTAVSYTATDWTTVPTSGLTVIVVGSEFLKGSGQMDESLEREVTYRSNNPIIMKDHYQIAGSDAAQIGWIEVTSENGGGNGFLWYIQSEMDTRARFENSIEKELLEGVAAAAGSDALTAGFTGHDGLFSVLNTRGNTLTGGFNDEGSAKDGRDDFDQIVKRLDAQGNIMENQMYLNRDESLAIDNILASQNGGGIGGGAQAGSSTPEVSFSYGSNFGMFNNSADMAMNLGFVGFMRGSYSFYKTDWKYLNSYTNAGAFTTGQTQGVIVPGGSSSVYDEGLNATIKRPMLHVRYRASEGENRKFKNWVTGSVGGVFTSGDDRMDVHYLTERCLVTQAANNFFYLKER